MKIFAEKIYPAVDVSIFAKILVLDICQGSGYSADIAWKNIEPHFSFGRITLFECGGKWSKKKKSILTIIFIANSSYVLKIM